MILKKIKLENIRSYENQEIEFPEGSTILAGDIGSGKTTVLLAIEFALFGLQPGQKGSGLLRNNKNDGSVKLEIEVDGRNVILERGLKRSKSVNQSYVKITIDGEEKETSITELKNKILEILNYPKEFAKKTNTLFRFTVYTPQEEMKQIILETPELRLNTLRHIFGIDKYKRIVENTQTFTIKLREQSRGYEGEIKDLDEKKKKLENTKENLKNLEKNLQKLEIELKTREHDKEISEKAVKEVEGKIKEKEKYEQGIEKTKIMLAGKRELIQGIEAEKKFLLKEIEEVKKLKFDEKQISELENNIKVKEKEKQDKNKIYLDISGKINSLNSKINETEKLKSQIFNLKLCPTCLQDVDEGYKKNIFRKFEEDIANSRKEIKKFEQEKEIILKEIDNLNQTFNDLQKNSNELKIVKIKLENIKEKQNKLELMEKQKFSTEKDTTLLEQQISILKESISLLKKYENIYEQKKKDLSEAEKKEREKEIELASTKKEKELTLKIIEEISTEIQNKEQIKNKLLNIQELEDWLSSNFLNIIGFTEKNIMLKLREEFSKLFNEWFNILVPEIFSVHLNEDFTPVIEQQDFSLDYSFLSGGERTAIALAYRLALNQVLNSMLSKIKTRDLVILDEPTDGFSEQQLDKMRDVLQELKVNQLIIVSHESKIESFVENIIKFRKEEGITKVER